MEFEARARGGGCRAGARFFGGQVGGGGGGGGARITKGALPALYALLQYRPSCPPSIEAPSISAECSSFRAPSA